MEIFQKLVVYYFSGTGNSKNVAIWLSRVAEEKNIPCELINIALIDRLSINPPDPEAVIAFVSPIHGFNYPPVMVNFLMRFPKGKNKILLMNTRAGMLIGKWITPGLSGIAFYLAALILRLKGFSIKAMYPVDLPSNWISLHPGLNDRTVKFLHERNKEKVTVFARQVLSGKSNFRGLHDIVQDLIVLPISLGYYFIGRFFLAKTFYASSDCNRCDLCIKGCPVKAIIKVDNRPFWTFHCESCMKCMGNCPKRAIETGHSAIIGFTWFFYSIFSVFLYKFFNLSFMFSEEHRILNYLIETALFFLFLAIWYYLVHYLIRYKFFDRLLVYTSLTKYKFWGKRYKAISD
ncbi:MAG: EFR1 family ferrodoxin [Bacteroidales bacterium]|nr:EFR1 family ferrodoxin [Bacteroidales bacterium]